VCEKDEEETNLIRVDAQAMSDNCQADLDKVMPLLDEASKALENLSSDDINTIKSYKEPPANMNKVLEGICIALGHEKKVKWEPKERGSFEKI
jgi:dynein heavy chain